MIRKAKRSSAANPDGSGLPGSVFGRPAFALRLAAPRADATRAPSPRSLAALLTLLTLIAALALAPAAGATPTHTELPGLSHENAFTRPCGVATDSEGDLYVSENTTFGRQLRIYGPAGGSPLYTSEVGNGCNRAVDSLGNIYFDINTGLVRKGLPSNTPPVTPSTTYPTESTFVAASNITGSDVNPLAVDPSNDHVYVTEKGNEVQEYTIPAEAYKLKCKGTETLIELHGTGGSETASTSAEIKAALEAASPGPECKTVTVAVGSPSTRKKITFSGALGSLNVPPIEVVKPSGNEGPITETNGFSRIGHYKPDGTVVSKTIGTGVPGAVYYGVDVYGANHNVYAVDVAHNKAYIFDPAGSTVLKEIDGSGSAACTQGAFTGMVKASLAVDQSNGNVLVSDIKGHGVVDEFNAAGKCLLTIQHTPAFVESEPSDIAVDNSTTANRGNVYISSGISAGTSSVYAYGPLSPQKTLTTTVTPGGSGEVKCNGTACAPKYAEESSVELKAEPSGVQVFKKWKAASGSALPCEGSTNPVCTVELATASAITAEFGPAGFNLKIEKDGTGSGTVTSSPAGTNLGTINCGTGPACEETYPPLAVVTLTATAAGGSEFSGWTTLEGTPTTTCAATTSPCEVTMSEPVKFKATFNDTTPPAAPTITDTDPDSPANDNSPKVKGSAEAGSTVKLYSGADCSGTLLASGSAASFATPGLTPSPAIAGDATTNFRATATDAAGNTSPCSAAFPYTEDSSAPAAPTITDTDPDSPANDNSPKVKGSAEAGSTVKLYSGADCSGTLLASGSAASFATPGLTPSPAIAGDATTNFRATATDAAGNTSPCSAAFPYTEDSSAPAAPTITDTDPDSPANDNSPKVKGSAEAGSTVKLYSGADCSGTLLASGSAASFATPGLTPSPAIAGDATTNFRATATDAAGNTSPCSAAFPYTEDSSAPAAPTITDTDPDSPANDNSPKVKGSAEAGSTVKLYSGADCSGTLLASGSAASFATPGLTPSPAIAGDATTNFRATATDAAGNTSPCSAAFPYTEDSTPPDTIIDTGPTGTTNDSTPTFTFHSTEVGSSFQCKVDAGSFASCTSPFTTSVLADGAHTFQVKATDAAGNPDPTPASQGFTVDTTLPLLKVVKNGFGTGTVTSSPAGTNLGTINCGTGPACEETYSPSTVVTLTATADGGSIFAGWATLQGTPTTTCAGTTSPCTVTMSEAVTFQATFNDTTAPAAPTITDTDPDSPANDNSPKVKGSAEAGSTVKLYSGADCSGTLLASGSAASFATPGLTPSPAIAGDATTNFRATATDAAGNTSPCSAAFPYTEDSSAPAAPTITDTDPDSPANDNSPKVKGSAEAGSTVKLYSGADCSGTLLASGSAASFATPGLTPSPAIAGDATTNFRATATDAAGNTSPCSAAFPYTEDSSAPAAPTITDTDPDSPANDNSPKVKGSAEAGSTVKLYSGADCSGTLLASGSAASFATPGLTPSPAIAGDATTNFRATATDAAGNTSPCSAAFPYTEDSSAPAAPTITDTDPDSPANDNSPKVKGSAEAGSTVKLYSGADCSGTLLASGSAASFATPGLTPSPAIAGDATTNFRATATDAAGNTSPCSAAFPYTEDSSAPAAPTITDTDPDSPANDNSPKVKGSAEAGSTVKLYSGADCSGTLLASGSAASFATPGLTPSPAIAGDATTNFRATATDAAGNTSPCSAAFPYTEDSSAPAAPTITDTDPDSPANDNSPKVKGSAEAGSTVKLYSGADCSGTLLASGSAASFATPGLTPSPAIAGDATTNFRATATDAAGNTSPCSAAFPYTEDSSAPAAPTITDTDPDSPANDNSPKVKGSAEAGSTVKLYSGADCSGTLLASGSAASFATPGLTPSPAIAGDATTNFRATATDAAGNTSPCSAAFPYTEDSSAPAAPTITDTDPDSPANDNSPKVKGSAEAGSTVKLYSGADCSGTLLASGSAASFATPGLTPSPAIAGDATTNFRATATDAAGNTSPCSAAFPYTEDSSAPAAPTITDTDPDSPANDNSPKVKGSAEAGSTVKLYSGADCSGTLLASGSAASFATPGLTPSPAIAGDATTNFRATATDAAGNTSPCSAAFPYTEDSTPPDTIIDTGPTGTTNDSTPTFTFHSTEVGSSFQCKVDAGSFASCTSPFTTSVLADGAHTFQVKATDAAGNPDPTPASQGFTVVTTHTINVTIVGTGSIECKDEGAISFGSCAGGFNVGHTVKLKETPGTAFVFSGWSEFAGSGTVTTPCTGVVTECEVKVDNDVTGKATFTAIPLPAITNVVPDKGPTKGGTVVTITGTNFKEASSVKFGPNNAAGFSVNPAGTEIEATSPVGSAGPVNVRVTTPGGLSAVVAADEFTYVSPHTLTVTKAGTGSGSVTCDGGACAVSYAYGSEVTLAATAASGSSFAGFSGGGCSGTGACIVTIEADTTVTATFNANPVEGPVKTCANTPSLCSPPPSNLVTVVSAKPQGSKVALKLTVPGPGSLTATGKKILTAKGTATGAGTFTLKLKLTGAGKKQLSKKGKVKVKVTITFTPNGGTPGTTTKTVTFKAPAGN